MRWSPACWDGTLAQHDSELISPDPAIAVTAWLALRPGLTARELHAEARAADTGRARSKSPDWRLRHARTPRRSGDDHECADGIPGQVRSASRSQQGLAARGAPAPRRAVAQRPF